MKKTFLIFLATFSLSCFAPPGRPRKRGAGRKSTKARVRETKPKAVAKGAVAKGWEGCPIDCAGMKKWAEWSTKEKRNFLEEWCKAADTEKHKYCCSSCPNYSTEHESFYEIHMRNMHSETSEFEESSLSESQDF